MKNLRLTLKAWPVIFLITVTLSYATQALAKAFGIDLPEQANIELVRRYAGWNTVFVLLVLQIVVILPVLEELLFRWCLWRAPLLCLRRHGTAVAMGIAVLSSCVFSFAHYVDYAACIKDGSFVLRALDNAFIALFFFGFAECWLYRRTGRLWVPMLNHALFNLTNLVLLFLIPSAT